MAGEATTGVTIMRVVKALDAGPMLATASRVIGPEETSVEVEAGLAQLGAVALVNVADRLGAGEVPGTPQDESAATYAHKLQKGDGIIDWTASAAVIHNQIRGLHPWPHAFTELDGDRCLLLESRVDDAVGSTPAAPGTIVEAHGDRFIVQAGSGLLNIVRLQLEGRRALRAREFLAGRRIGPGAAFSRSAA
jgi:methionyl-tRNA formyltransferase